MRRSPRNIKFAHFCIIDSVVPFQPINRWKLPLSGQRTARGIIGTLWVQYPSRFARQQLGYRKILFCFTIKERLKCDHIAPRVSWGPVLLRCICAFSESLKVSPTLSFYSEENDLNPCDIWIVYYKHILRFEKIRELLF